MLFFFIGFMGSGKSFFAQKIGRIMQLPFVDMDTYIQEKEKLPIRKIFEVHGENYFRMIEQQALHFLINEYTNQNIIIATGGGTPCFFDNMKMMNYSGTTIYFNLSVNTLCSLLKKEKGKRPLLKNLSEQELFSFVEKKLAEREPFYNQATISLQEKNVNTNYLLNLIQSYV